MRKKLLILIALVLALCLLAGCTESEISCGIDSENRAFLRYDLSIDMRELNVTQQLSLIDWLRQMVASWEEQGFTVEHGAFAATGGSIDIHAELIRQAEDGKQALEQLRTILTDEKCTPFTAVQAEVLAQPLTEDYLLTLRLEPDRIFAAVGTERFPDELREKVEQWAESGSIRLSAQLPATEPGPGETAVPAEGLCRKEMSIPLNGSGELSLSTRRYLGGGEFDEVWWGGGARSAQTAEELEAAVRADENRLHVWSVVLTVLASILGAAALGLLIRLLASGRRRKAEEEALQQLDQALYDEAGPAFESCKPEPDPEAEAEQTESASAPEETPNGAETVDGSAPQKTDE